MRLRNGSSRGGPYLPGNWKMHHNRSQLRWSEAWQSPEHILSQEYYGIAMLWLFLSDLRIWNQASSRGTEHVADSGCHLRCSAVPVDRTWDETCKGPTRDGAAQHHPGGTPHIVGFKSRSTSLRCSPAARLVGT